MSFIHDDFLLQTKAARDLYHNHAEGQPIIDYHSHLPPEDVAEDKKFDNLYDIWLAGDHYKWRAMRAAGMPEEVCTGDADPYDKFLAWARTVPLTIRNPLYHWTHLELKRYFGIDELLSEGMTNSKSAAAMTIPASLRPSSHAMLLSHFLDIHNMTTAKNTSPTRRSGTDIPWLCWCPSQLLVRPSNKGPQRGNATDEKHQRKIADTWPSGSAFSYGL